MLGGIGNWGDWIIMSSKDKKIFFSILGIPLIVFFTVMLYNVFFGMDGNEGFLEHKKRLQFSGKIDSTYRDSRNHNIKMQVLDNGYEYQTMAEWENLIDVGDSISKKKDSLYIIVVKPDGKKLKLDYVEAVKNWRK